MTIKLQSQKGGNQQPLGINNFWGLCDDNGSKLQLYYVVTLIDRRGEATHPESHSELNAEPGCCLPGRVLLRRESVRRLARCLAAGCLKSSCVPSVALAGGKGGQAEGWRERKALTSSGVGGVSFALTTPSSVSADPTEIALGSQFPSPVPTGPVPEPWAGGKCCD